MTQPVLPLELHELIIETIGDEDIGDALEPPLFRLKDTVLRTLRSCSLVCRDWHSFTLRHIFRTACLDLRSEERGLKRITALSQLLDANPSIKRCIRRVEMYLRSTSSREAVERVCHAISPIETMHLVIDYYQPEHPPSHTSPLAGLHPILTTQHLRDLTISSERLPLHLLEDLTNLRSLTLQGVRTLDIDYDHDGTWRSSTLEKLVVSHPYAIVVLNQIWAATLGNRNVGLAAFFDRLKYLRLDLNTGSLTRGTSWASLLARWRCLETLDVQWRLTGEFLYISALTVPNTNRLHF